jgi:hypothetical protein
LDGSVEGVVLLNVVGVIVDYCFENLVEVTVEINIYLEKNKKIRLLHFRPNYLHYTDVVLKAIFCSCSSLITKSYNG